MDNKICKNCRSIIENNFCSNCGQPVKAERLNAHYLIEEFQHTVLHADKGILYTIKELFLNPKKIITEYIDGTRRVGVFKPFGFLIILATVNGFLSHFLNITYELDFSAIADISAQDTADLNSKYYDIYKLLYSHYSIFSLASILPVSLFSWLLFKRSGYNYIEHLIVNAYVLGQQCFIYVLLIPLFLLTSGNIYFDIATLLSYGYFAWVYVKLFTQYKSIAARILKTLLVLLFYILMVMFVGLIVGFLLY